MKPEFFKAPGCSCPVNVPCGCQLSLGSAGGVRVSVRLYRYCCPNGHYGAASGLFASTCYAPPKYLVERREGETWKSVCVVGDLVALAARLIPMGADGQALAALVDAETLGRDADYPALIALADDLDELEFSEIERAEWAAAGSGSLH